ncbi:MAG: TIR domain-containing protein [Kordiimonadaceae bacterium]|nr:TIR domain-containing protein [Kordiimonadaceae bacterium]
MADDFQYRAFLSYSHVDKKWGEWLHKQLEKYKIPKGLAKRKADGTLERSLGRIFRDRDELPAAENLSHQVQQALAASEFLIVLCSPAAAASVWVNKEVIEFKRMRGDKYVFPVILSGEPFASDISDALDALDASKTNEPSKTNDSSGANTASAIADAFDGAGGDAASGDAASGDGTGDGKGDGNEGGKSTDASEECYPPGVRYRVLYGAGLSTVPAEPSAADMRKGKDGKKRAILKLVAGILGVGLDQLIERDMRRRQQRVMAITAGSLVGMLVMAVLTFDAMRARETAERSRNETEDLVEFMLTDLREKLEPVGRIDVLDAVATKVFEHHKKQATYGALSDDDLGRQTRAYHLMGEMQSRRGNLDDAQVMFDRALAATGELLRRDPENAKRIFEHAQSVYWVGSLYMEAGRFDDTLDAYEDYMALAEQLVAIDPLNVDWQLELAYANNNIGWHLGKYAKHPTDALPYIEKALELFRQVSAARPNSPFLKTWIASQYNNFGRVHALVGHVDDLDRFRQLEKNILDDLIETDSRDQMVIELLNTWHISQGMNYALLGRHEKSIESFQAAIEFSDAQLQLDPENVLWLEQKVITEYYLADALIYTEEFTEAEQHIQQGRRIYEQEIANGMGATDLAKDLQYKALLTMAKLKVAQQGLALSLELVDSAFLQLQPGIKNLLKSKRGRWFLGGFYLLKIQSLLAQDKLVRAEVLLDEISTYISTENLSQIPHILIPMRDIFTLMGKREQALRIQKNLYERGYVQTTELPAQMVQFSN